MAVRRQVDAQQLRRGFRHCRIELPWRWLYVVLVFTVAISVALPLFLIARTRKLASARDSL